MGDPTPDATDSGCHRRRAQTVRQIRNIDRMAPAFQLKHPMGPDDPEEDFWLLNPSLRSATFYTFLPLLSYSEWHREQDMTEPYGRGARCSRVSSRHTRQATGPQGADPTAYLSELRQAAPAWCGADLARPVPVVGSLNTCCTRFMRWSLPTATPWSWEAKPRVLSWMGARNRAARATNDAVLDVRYDGLIADPIGVVESIHQHLGLRWRTDTAAP